MERGPAHVGTEVGTTVATECIGQQIAVIIIIGFAREERRHGRRTEAGANLCLARSQCRVLDAVRGQVGVVGTYVVPFAFPALLSDHGREGVLANLAVVGQIVLDLDELAASLLHAGLVLVLGPVAQVDGGLERRGAVPVKVVANLSVPDQSFHKGNVGEEVSAQQVTLVTIVVHQGQSHGVGVAHTFARDRSVAALDVVDGLIGRRGQCVGDDALVLIGLQQFLRGVRVGSVQA